MARKKYREDSELVKTVIKMYVNGATYRDIANQLGIARATVGNIIHGLIQRGVLDGRRINTVNPVREDETVNCTTAVSKKCIYGCDWAATEGSPLCNYILHEKKMRGCPHNRCDKYTEGKKKSLRWMPWF